MKHVVIVFLYIFAVTEGLKLSAKPKEGIVASHDATNHNNVSVSQVKNPHPSKLVWFLGSSIDDFAVRDYCTYAKANIVFLPTAHPLPPGKLPSIYCLLDGITLVFSFHPGASPPPYYSGAGNVYKTPTADRITMRLQEMYATFGKFPDATIADSSIWDVASWWEQGGKPAAWPVPYEKINNWCHATVPNFLNLLQQAMPHGHIAFRTPTPVFNSNWRLWMQSIWETTDVMFNSLITAAHSNTGHLLFGKYPLIDYHQAVEQKRQALGTELRPLYRDETHPGPVLDVAMITAALAWVNGL